MIGSGICIFNIIFRRNPHYPQSYPQQKSLFYGLLGPFTHNPGDNPLWLSVFIPSYPQTLVCKWPYISEFSRFLCGFRHKIRLISVIITHKQKVIHRRLWLLPPADTYISINFIAFLFHFVYSFYTLFIPIKVLIWIFIDIVDKFRQKFFPIAPGTLLNRR